MTENTRIKRNAARLRECNQVFAMRVSKILGRMEALGFRPRIQEAYRSRSDQLAAFQRGASRVKVGFHNMTSPEGKPDSCAVDVLDDDNPKVPPIRYMLALAWAAKQEKCVTGVDWGSPAAAKKRIAQAIADQNFDLVIDRKQIGWDACHVQPADVSLDAALKGARPQGA